MIVATDKMAKSAAMPIWTSGVKRVCTLGVFTVSYFAAYHFGMSFTQKFASPFWFPDSVLLCFLLLNMPRNWWPFIVLTLPIRLFTSIPPNTPLWFLFACFLNDSAKAILTAWLLRSDSAGQGWFDSPRKYAKYFLIAVTIVPVLSALAGAASRVAQGFSFWPSWGSWFLGNSLTGLVITPGLLGLAKEFRQIASHRAKVYVEISLISAGLLSTGYISFLSYPGFISRYPFIVYLQIPFLLWAAIRFGLLGTSASLTLLGTFFITGVSEGTGPLQASASGQVSIQLLLFVISVPLMFLSVKIQQQRKTELALRESEERFRSVIDTAPVMVWMSGINALAIFFNKPWLEFTGRLIGKELGHGWIESVHPSDRDQCAKDYLEAFHARRPFTFEYRLLHRNKSYRWVFGNGKPRFAADGTFLGYIGSCIDITSRKQAEEKLKLMRIQLINDQETERIRIGQELHDDLAQRLAALSIKLSCLSQSDVASRQELSHELEEVQQQILTICRDVANLSHQLRPPSLERLGLTLALRDLCERTTNETVRVACSMTEEFLSLPEAISVSMYRVAQEALWNAQAHSGAHQIHIDLKIESSDLILSIVDDGCGFAVDSGPGNGLGLPTMSERMRVIGGNLTVASNPGIGTTITAILPLKRTACV